MPGRFIGEDDAVALAGWLSAREHVGWDAAGRLVRAAGHGDHRVEGLAAHENRVDCGEKARHECRRFLGHDEVVHRTVEPGDGHRE